jgi:uncharacterized protein (DUF4415 family)
MARSSSNATDWDRLKIMPDSDLVYTEDAPATAPEDWEEAIAHRGIDALKAGLAPRQSKPETVPATIPLDAEVLDYFKRQGEGWQRRLNAALREYIVAHPR